MTDNAAHTPTYIRESIPCLVCGEPLAVRSARGRKSNKPFIMLQCGTDSRHFRGFINDQDYVRRVQEHLEARQ